MLEDEVDGVAEDTMPPPRARRAHDDDLALPALRLVDDRPTGVARPDDPLRELHAVELCDRRRDVEGLVGGVLLFLEPCVQRQVERHDDHAEGRNRGTSVGGEAAGQVDRLLRGATRLDGNEDVPVLERDRRPDDHRGMQRRRERLVKNLAAVNDVADEPDHEPPKTGPSWPGLLDDDDDPGDPGAEPAEDREQRPVDASDPQARAHLERLRIVPRAQTQRDHGHVRDRERQHRAERVHVAEEIRPARQEHDNREQPAEDQQRQPGSLELRMQPAEDLGQLLVRRHGIRDARRADHAGVGRDQEDRRSQDADVDLRGLQHLTVQPQVLHEAEHRIVLEATLVRTDAEQRLVPVRGLLHR